MVVCHSTLASAGGTSHDIEYMCTIKGGGKKALGKTSLSCLPFLLHQASGMYVRSMWHNVHTRTCMHPHRKEKHREPFSHCSIEAWNRSRRVGQWFQWRPPFFFLNTLQQNPLRKFTQFNSDQICMSVSFKRGGATLLYSAQTTNSCANGSDSAKGYKEVA